MSGLNRKIKQWNECNPSSMVNQMSDSALIYALDDAKHDILKLAEIVRMIGFPRRGTEEESFDIFDASKLILSNFTLEELME